MSRNTSALLVLATGALLLAALACNESETIAPDGATISLSANPAQVIIVGGNQVSDVTILATVRDVIGVPLPGQDVRFTTSNGKLNPSIGTPVATDDLGNATCVLTGAQQGPQITATSGKATASITLTAGSSPIAFLTITPSDAQTIIDCGDSFDFTITAEDANNDPVEGVRIFIEFVSNGNADAVTGNFTPSNDVTDVNGEILTTLQIDDSVCADNCNDPKDCRAQIRARDQGGLVFSNPVDILDGIQ